MHRFICFTHYREYKEALKQQRAQDVPSIYRTKDSDDHSYKTEPNTPTHNALTPHSTLATSKSDPTPLNSALSSPKHIFDDTTFKTPTSRPCVNGDGHRTSPKHYVKPKSPMKGSSGILAHGHVPLSSNTIFGSPPVNGTNGARQGEYVNGSGGSLGKGMNGMKAGRTISWNKELPPEKLSFTMRREIDKAREETDLINKLRKVREKMFYLLLEYSIKNVS